MSENQLAFLRPSPPLSQDLDEKKCDILYLDFCFEKSTEI